MKKFAALSFDERKAMGLAGRNRMEAMFDKKNYFREKKIERVGKDIL